MTTFICTAEYDKNRTCPLQIETRFATGEVKGKYGYVDPTGQLREVEYGASPERGFEPRAEGLVVAPPTLADDSGRQFNRNFLGLSFSMKNHLSFGLKSSKMGRLDMS